MSTAAPSATRTKARKAGGTPSSTAILMKRYGMPQRVETVAKAAHARALIARTLASGPLAPVLAAQGGAQVRDLDDRRADVRVARGEDLLLEVGHVARVVAQGRVEREHPLVLEEGQVLLDVGGVLDGHGLQG